MKKIKQSKEKRDVLFLAPKRLFFLLTILLEKAVYIKVVT